MCYYTSSLGLWVLNSHWCTIARSYPSFLSKWSNCWNLHLSFCNSTSVLFFCIFSGPQLDISGVVFFHQNLTIVNVFSGWVVFHLITERKFLCKSQCRGDGFTKANSFLSVSITVLRDEWHRGQTRQTLLFEIDSYLSLSVATQTRSHHSTH